MFHTREFKNHKILIFPFRHFLVRHQRQTSNKSKPITMKNNNERIYFLKTKSSFFSFFDICLDQDKRKMIWALWGWMIKAKEPRARSKIQEITVFGWISIGWMKLLSIIFQFRNAISYCVLYFMYGMYGMHGMYTFRF